MTFVFTRQGVSYRVHTEVGEGPARVVLEEIPAPPKPQDEKSGGAA